jgi:hypothetical protein
MSSTFHLTSIQCALRCFALFYILLHCWIVLSRYRYRRLMELAHPDPHKYQNTHTHTNTLTQTQFRWQSHISSHQATWLTVFLHVCFKMIEQQSAVSLDLFCPWYCTECYLSKPLRCVRPIAHTCMIHIHTHPRIVWGNRMLCNLIYPGEICIDLASALIFTVIRCTSPL